MSLIAPFALLALPLLPVIVVFYMLKLKRKPRQVPSTLLWRRSVQDLIANSPFQKLRNNLLMWLQLLIVAALIAALARPVMRLSGLSGNTVVLLIDQTASMATREAGQRRIDAAKQRAIEVIDSLAGRDEAIVVSFGGTTRVIQTLTGDKSLLRNAVNSIAVTDEEASLRETALLIEGITTKIEGDNLVRTPRADAKTVIISDGGLGEEARRLGDIGAVEFVLVGEATENLGITNVDVRASFTGTFENQVFVSVDNTGTQDRTALLELTLGTETVDVKELSIPAGKTANEVFTLGESASGVARLRLDVENEPFDRDDEAVVVVNPPRRLSVLVVSAENFFLEQALNSDPRVDLSRVTPVDYPSLSGDYDLTVFDNATAGEIGTGTFLFINALPPVQGYAKGEELERPRVIDWNRTHPVMRYVSLEALLIGKGLSITTPSAAIALAETESGPIITLQEMETRRVLVVGFDIFKSYWPVDVSFPIFIANVIDYARRAGTGGGRAAWRAGDVVPVLLPKGATTATVTSPSGTKSDLDFAGAQTAYVTATGEQGIYRVAFDNGQGQDIAVNVQSLRESRIAPNKELDLGSRTLQGEAEPGRENREIWPWLAALALAVLSVEWIIYCRRTWL